MIQIPYVVLERLKEYRRALSALDKEYVTSEEIAKLSDVSADLVRRDFMYLKTVGLPKKGYNRIWILNELDNIFSIKKDLNIIIFGAGRLGQAIAAYTGFDSYGVKVVAIFDNDQKKIGNFVGELVILKPDIEIIKRVIKRFSVSIAAICVPPESAQEVANMLVGGGIKGLWNFAQVKLRVPKEVVVVDEDITKSLLSLKRLVESNIDSSVSSNI